MHNARKTERGQALVLIVFAIVGLIGITGLAIDGGNAYSDRRHAQNAADTAALATALSKVRTGWPSGASAGYQVAGANGYDNNGTSNIVHVYRCDDANSSCTLPNPLPSGDTTQNYVQVTIQSTIPTYFARILGIPTMSNYVQSVARAKESQPVAWYNGNALVSLMPGCKPNGWPDDPFTLSGSSVTIVNGTSGVFVNSNCDPAFTSSNNTSLTAPGTCVVGGVSSDGSVNPAPQPGCGSQVDQQTYMLPPLGSGSCTTAGHIDKVGSTYYAYPGNYSGTFPNVSPAGDLKLQRGIYCLNNGNTALDFNSGWNATTDMNENGNMSDPGEGVVFYIPHGAVTINGGASVHLSAMEDAAADAVGLKGYLLYVPPTNTNAVNIAGGGSSALQGSILAPGAPISVSGNSTSQSFNLESQIVGYSIKMTGSGLVQITYNQSVNGTTWTNPLLQPYNNK